MAAAPDRLAALRQLLAGRFPTDFRPAGRTVPTGLPAIDDATGGLPAGALTEIVCAAPSCGGQLLLASLLAAQRERRGRVALVDPADAFDPQSHPSDLLAHLVWVRCRETSAALTAADLLLRDANLALVILDLRRATESDLRRPPATTWYRLQHAAEQGGLPLVVLTPRSAAPSARLRLVLDQPHRLAQLDTPRAFLIAALRVAIQRQRLAAATA